ncbi:Sushi, von Willebrand factor type A, EGF and pentraxin domain-containing protein 1 [Stylophora pistillata]|uniref:Sushi, von Willebrand factor type A, EGF and pentraxin domain-containing protein 1 n=1 Tax=Stylophora pistillata TaxID=50429 RepID=A0A2B4RRI2_STYPI|nr:Sushi, von Willebrand factor type A, EGF and pentraxin domain-containing protein 1 [Stylophora pistillata]
MLTISLALIMASLLVRLRHIVVQARSTEHYVPVKMLTTVRSTHGLVGLDQFPKEHANVRVVTATTINIPNTTLETTIAMVSQAVVETESTTIGTGVHVGTRLAPSVDGPIGWIFQLQSMDTVPPSAEPGATLSLGDILKDETTAMVLDHSHVHLLNHKTEKKLSLVLPLEIHHTGAGTEMIVELTRKYVDVRPPTIICPNSISVSTDPRKATAKVCIPKATASDNSGQQPVITTSVGAGSKDFIAQSAPHEVVYTARDAAGLESRCTLQITVSDTERPGVAFCPSDIKRESANAVRVTWEYPRFEDNLDKPPVQLLISSNRNPGVEFPWGIYPVIYEASDRAGNKAKCEFTVEVGPVPCRYYDAPAYGIRACNKNTSDSNGVRYEMICVIQCKQGYGFSDPTTPNTYWCRSDGVWTKLFNGIAHIPVPDGQRPWPDCSPQESVAGAQKNFTFYTGSCADNEQEALAQIRLNFLHAVQNSPLANFALCDVSQGQDCVVENVKVYCGQNSRKRSVGGERVITFDFVIKDMKASSDPKEEAIRIAKIMKDLDILESYVTKSFANDAQMPGMQISAAASSAACPAGKMVQVVPGDSSELERTVCANFLKDPEEINPKKYDNVEGVSVLKMPLRGAKLVLMGCVHYLFVLVLVLHVPLRTISGPIKDRDITNWITNDRGNILSEKLGSLRDYQENAISDDAHEDRLVNIGSLRDLHEKQLSDSAHEDLSGNIRSPSDYPEKKLSNSDNEDLSENIESISDYPEKELSNSDNEYLVENIGSLSDYPKKALSNNAPKELAEKIGSLHDYPNSVNEDPSKNVGNLRDNAENDIAQFLPKEIAHLDLSENIESLSNFFEKELSKGAHLDLSENIQSLSDYPSKELSDTDNVDLHENIGPLSDYPEKELFDSDIEDLSENIGPLSDYPKKELSDSDNEDLPESFGPLSDYPEKELSDNDNEDLSENIGPLKLSDSDNEDLSENIRPLSDYPDKELSDSDNEDLSENIGSLNDYPSKELSDSDNEDLSENVKSLSDYPDKELSDSAYEDLTKNIESLRDYPDKELSKSAHEDLTENIEFLSDYPEKEFFDNAKADLSENIGSLRKYPENKIYSNAREDFSQTIASLRDYPENQLSDSAPKDLSENVRTLHDYPENERL